MVVALVSGLLAPAPAWADDPPSTVPIEWTPPLLSSPPDMVQNLVVSSSTTIVNTATSEIKSGNGWTFGSQCTTQPTGTTGQNPYQSCIGANTTFGQMVTVTGGPQDRMRAGTNPALQWILAEARDHIGSVYSVPVDNRIDAYAQDQIRAYVMIRLIGIADKEAYGQKLTPDEQRSLDWMNERLLEPERLVSQAAYEEWQKWANQSCLYRPPPAPAWITEPRGLPDIVRNYCNRSRSFANIFTTTATPSVDDFRTWGLYRVVNEQHLLLLTPQEQGPALGTTAAYVQLGGFAVGVATGVAAYSGLAASSAAATSVAAAMGSLAPTAAAGLAAGAAAAGVLAVALVTLAVSIWQFAEAQQIGPNLAAEASAAAGRTDPLGLQGLKVQNVGKPFPQDVTDHPPPYRGPALESQLTALVVANIGVGPQDSWTWTGDAHTTFDQRFRQGTQTVDQITLPKTDGTTTTVWFSKGWFIEQGSDGVRHPRLVLDYVNANGEKEQAWRSGNSFFVVTYHDQPDGTATTTVRVGALHMRGQSLSVALAPREEELVGGVRPGAAGLLVPGAPVHLRPNPFHANGNFALEDFLDGYVYTWQVSRVAEDGTLVPLTFEYRQQGSNARYGARFTPDRPGAYSATVTVTKPGDPEAVPLSGQVNFQISEPDVTLPVLALHDDGASQLRVQLRAEQRTPLEGPIDVSVQWPGAIDSEDPGPVTSVRVTCLRYDAITCNTPDSDLSNEFGTALRHTLGPNADLTDGVIVTVSTPGGATRTQRLEIDQSQRLAFVAGPGLKAGQYGGIVFNPRLTSVTVPAAVDGNQPTYAVAAVSNVKGATNVSIVDPATNTPQRAVDLFAGTEKAGRYLASVDQEGGQWLLNLRAVPRAQDIGSDTVPIIIQTSDGRRATMRVTLNVLVAPDDKYRGVLHDDIPDSDFTVAHLPQLTPDVAGGAAEWGAYTGEVCVGIDDQTRCGPVAEIVGDGDVPFPFETLLPHGISPGIHYASAWLPQASERVWDIPVKAPFSLLSSPPVVSDLSWNTTVLHATITPGVTVSTSAPVPIDRAECALDGGAWVACFAGGAATSWNPGALSAGHHELRLRVYDTAGNYDTRTLGFDRDTAATEATETSVRPPQRFGNVVTIPEPEPGTEYRDGAANTVLTPGNHRLIGTLTVRARALPGYVIAPGETTEWTFTADPSLIEVATVPAPIVNDNIMQLPWPWPTGVTYVDRYGEPYGAGSYELSEGESDTVVYARPADGYTFTADAVTAWVFSYSEQAPRTLGVSDASVQQDKPVGGVFERYVVIVRGSDGAPVAGQAVTFEITQGASFGAGGPTVQRVVTDRNGIAGTSLPVVATSLGPVLATARLARGEAVPLGRRTVVPASVASATVLVRSEVVGGRVRLIFEITNTSAVSATGQLRTSFGTKTTPALAADGKATITVNTGLRTVAAGQATLALTTAAGTQEISVLYPATSGAG